MTSYDSMIWSAVIHVISHMSSPSVSCTWHKMVQLWPRWSVVPKDRRRAPCLIKNVEHVWGKKHVLLSSTFFCKQIILFYQDNLPITYTLSLSPGLPLWFISVYPCTSGLAHDICVRILRFHARSTHQTTTHRHGNMERCVEFTNRVHNWQSLSATTVRPLMGPGDLTEMSNRSGKRSENTKNTPSFPPCIARTRSVSASNGKPGTIFYTDSAFASLNKTNCSVLTVSPQQKERKERFWKKSHRHL